MWAHPLGWPGGGESGGGARGPMPPNAGSMQGDGGVDLLSELALLQADDYSDKISCSSNKISLRVTADAEICQDDLMSHLDTLCRTLTEQWDDLQGAELNLAVGSLLRVLVNISFLFDSERYPEHTSIPRIFVAAERLNKLVIDICISWILSPVQRRELERDDTCRTVTSLVTLLHNYVSHEFPLKTRPFCDLLLAHKDLDSFLGQTVEIVVGNVGSDPGVQSRLQQVCVEFWNAIVNWNIPDEATFDRLRASFVKHHALQDLVKHLLRRIEHDEEPVYFLALLFSSHDFIPRLLNELSEIRQLCMATIFACLTAVIVNPLRMSENPRVHLLETLVSMAATEEGRTALLTEWHAQLMQLVTTFVGQWSCISTAGNDRAKKMRDAANGSAMQDNTLRTLGLFYRLYGEVHSSDAVFASYLRSYFPGPDATKKLLEHLRGFQGGQLLKESDLIDDADSRNFASLVKVVEASCKDVDQGGAKTKKAAGAKTAATSAKAQKDSIGERSIVGGGGGGTKRGGAERSGDHDLERRSAEALMSLFGDAGLEQSSAWGSSRKTAKKSGVRDREVAKRSSKRTRVVSRAIKENGDVDNVPVRSGESRPKSEGAAAEPVRIPKPVMNEAPDQDLEYPSSPEFIDPSEFSHIGRKPAPSVAIASVRVPRIPEWTTGGLHWQPKDAANGCALPSDAAVRSDRGHGKGGTGSGHAPTESWRKPQEDVPMSQERAQGGGLLYIDQLGYGGSRVPRGGWQGACGGTAGTLEAEAGQQLQGHSAFAASGSVPDSLSLAQQILQQYNHAFLQQLTGAPVGSAPSMPIGLALANANMGAGPLAANGSLPSLQPNVCLQPACPPSMVALANPNLPQAAPAHLPSTEHLVMTRPLSTMAHGNTTNTPPIADAAPGANKDHTNKANKVPSDGTDPAASAQFAANGAAVAGAAAGVGAKGGGEEKTNKDQSSGGLGADAAVGTNGVHGGNKVNPEAGGRVLTPNVWHPYAAQHPGLQMIRPDHAILVAQRQADAMRHQQDLMMEASGAGASRMMLLDPGGQPIGMVVGVAGDVGPPAMQGGLGGMPVGGVGWFPGLGMVGMGGMPPGGGPGVGGVPEMVGFPTYAGQVMVAPPTGVVGGFRGVVGAGAEYFQREGGNVMGGVRAAHPGMTSGGSVDALRNVNFSLPPRPLEKKNSMKHIEIARIIGMANEELRERSAAASASASAAAAAATMACVPGVVMPGASCPGFLLPG